MTVEIPGSNEQFMLASGRVSALESKIVLATRQEADVADIERPKIPGFAGAITLAALSRANLLSADFTLERFTQAVESIEQDMKLDVPGDEAWSSDQGIR